MQPAKHHVDAAHECADKSPYDDAAYGRKASDVYFYTIQIGQSSSSRERVKIDLFVERAESNFRFQVEKGDVCRVRLLH